MEIHFCFMSSARTPVNLTRLFSKNPMMASPLHQSGFFAFLIPDNQYDKTPCTPIQSIPAFENRVLSLKLETQSPLTKMNDIESLPPLNAPKKLRFTRNETKRITPSTQDWMKPNISSTALAARIQFNSLNPRLERMNCKADLAEG